MILDDYKKLLEQVQSAQHENLNTVHDNINKLKDPVQRDILSSALERAKSGELNAADFIKEFNNMIHGG